MAFIGPWGCFIHIPRTGGHSIRQWLQAEYRADGRESGPSHWMPQEPIPYEMGRAFTYIREPAAWLRSLWGLLNRTSGDWTNPDNLGPVVGALAQEVWGHWGYFADNALELAAPSPTFLNFARAYLRFAPGGISWVFNSYAFPGVEIRAQNPADKRVNTSKDHYNQRWPEIPSWLRQELFVTEREIYERYFVGAMVE